MPEEQLKLLITRSVFQQRFGAAFFRSLPCCAGVYLMCNGESRVIYVGKAKSLRQRIGSYRYADEQCSRKTARLVARVASIRWQACASEEAALLEENRLLRELRPRFNRMNTWPKTARFIRITVTAAGVQLSLSAEPEGECYGAFKGASRENFGALLRFLCARNGRYDLLPRRLLLERTPAFWEFPNEQAGTWLESLRFFLGGDADELLKNSPAGPALGESLFYSTFRQTDLLALEHFFRIGPQRNRMLRERFGAGRLIAQHELDDLIVRHRLAQRVSDARTNAESNFR